MAGDTERRPLPLTELTAISILDGRNRKDVAEIAEFTSEYYIIRTRIEVEAAFLIHLSDAGVMRPLSPEQKQQLGAFGSTLSLDGAKEVKEIEDKTNHDVEAVKQVFRQKLQGTPLEDLTEMVHLGLTSEDVNNIAYRMVLKRVTNNVFLPTFRQIIEALVDQAEKYKAVPMLARTHGQPAAPTTLGKELAVFAMRLNKEVTELEKRELQGKLTGAVGNLNSLQFAYPDVDWQTFAANFVRSFGLIPNFTTTQINPYEDIIAYLQNYQRANGILLDFDQDMWRYISDHWFVQEVQADTVGSSAMPQKVNPIRFENSEGNLGKANALFDYFTRKLSISRLQRDLSDSTVIRDIGLPLGYSLLGYKNILRGVSRVKPNFDQIQTDLNSDWSILAEPAQILMRRLGVEDPYTLMRKLTQGKRFGESEWKQVIEQLPISEEYKKMLRVLNPENYLGFAVQFTEDAIDEIQRALTGKKIKTND